MAINGEPNRVPQFRQKLEESLADPEPMCLAMVRVETTAFGGDNHGPSDVSESDVDQLMAAVQARLSHVLRRYDLMARVEKDTFMLVVKTLADTRVLDARMYQLYGALSEPYSVGGKTVSVPVTLGAAVRLPAESAASLMKRTDKALATAGAAGGKAPVLI
ncbi:MAG: GGDEF domain-containing protein [Acidimicrobiia bacterium]|nr:GGDEF domain-containing protein [Acidimicrobiia bacterium]